MSKLAKILVIPVQNRQRSTNQGVDVIERERHARWVLLALVIGALGFFWVGASLYRGEEQAGLRNISAQARLGLYSRTLVELETVCRDPNAASGSLRDHCVAQARFVALLPECMDACQRAAALVLPHMRR